MDTNPTNDYGPLPIDPDCYYTPKLAAQGIRTAVRTLESWRQKGIGPEYVRMGGRLIRYKGSGLLKFADERTFSSTSEEAQRAA